MKNRLKAFLKKLRRFVRSLPERGIDERIDGLSGKLDCLLESYGTLELIGKGKDGLVFRVRGGDGEALILNLLSNYARHYLPVTKHIMSLGLQSRFLYDLRITDDKYLLYPSEELSTPDTTGAAFALTLKKLCEMEQELLTKGILFWDFGFSQHSNYLLKSDGQPKIIDYGGNSFLFVDPVPALELGRRRRNLVAARNDFLRAAFLLHIICYGLGQRTDWPSAIQHAGKAVLGKCLDFCKGQLLGTSYEPVALAVLEADLLTAEGWSRVSDALDEAAGAEKFIYEPADISDVQFVDGEVRVSGYQNYTISKERIAPKRAGEKLWETTDKLALVEKALDGLIARGLRIQTILDIGCNAGLYLFLAKQRLGAESACGIDYNGKYIKLCDRVVEHLGLSGCKFAVSTFSDIEGEYDCVLAMGLIHHLYHRTEQFGSLGAIMRRFAELAGQALIIEFPLATDPKAGKWTSIKGRAVKEDYSRSNFLAAAGKHFNEVIEIGRIGTTRLTYLLLK